MATLRSILALVIVLLIAFAACGSESDDGDSRTITRYEKILGERGAVGMADTRRSKVPVMVVEHPRSGTILVDSEGFSLYAFTRDGPDSSNCHDHCANTWPPLLSSDGATGLAGEGVDADLVGTISRIEGPDQVTYGGRPLYNFSGDFNPGETLGAGVNKVWFLVSPDGELVN